jgi:MvdD-like protein with pre-ATP grasp domain
MMTVLVLASEWDRTADGVVSGLTERGVAVMRVDLSWFPQRLTLDAEFCGGSWHGHLRTEHHEVDIATVRSVWVRTPSSFQMPDGMSAVEREFAKREAELGVGGVLLALPDVLWVNRPDLAGLCRCGQSAPGQGISPTGQSPSALLTILLPGVPFAVAQSHGSALLARSLCCGWRARSTCAPSRSCRPRSARASSSTLPISSSIWPG